MNKNKLFLLIASLIAIPVVAYAGWPTAFDPGTSNTLSTTQETCIAANPGVHGWCIKNKDASIDVRFWLSSATITTATGMELKAGTSYCEPHGGEQPYSGDVKCIAESGTPAVDTLSY